MDQALLIIVQELNQFLKLRFDLNENKILLSSIMDQDGKMSTQEENKILFTLVDISEETVLKNKFDRRSTGHTSDVFINIKVLCSAYFNALNYSDSLKYLTAIISFFHAKPSFNTSNTPNLTNTSINKLNVEMIHQDTNSKNNLWSILGAKYMPSVLYKVGLFIISDSSIKQQIDQVKSVDLDNNSNLR